jgi:hypothetical protein
MLRVIIIIIHRVMRTNTLRETPIPTLSIHPVIVIRTLKVIIMHRVIITRTQQVLVIIRMLRTHKHFKTHMLP